MQENNKPLYKACRELVGAHRHVQPHKNLIQTNFREVKSMFGNVDEYYFTCNDCGKEWMRETGSYGEGWM